MHTLIFTEDADATRAFFRDVLGFPAADAGGGWLIFKTGPSELAAHPADEGGGEQFDVSLLCDDLDAAMAELSGKGAEFVGEIGEQRWGRTISLRIPGAGQMLLYQPRYDPPALA